MTLSKIINPLTISIVGVLLTIIAAVLIFFLLIQKTQADLAQQTSTYNSNVSAESPSAKAAAVAGVTKAKQQVAAVEAQWQAIQVAKDPVIDYGDRMKAWSEYINELNFKLAPMVEQWLPTTGIKPIGPITVPAPPADPNAVVALNPIIIPLNGGSPITVIGSFPQILKSIEAWDNFNRIVLVDKLTLAGVSPFITATYTATVYEFPINASTPGPAVPSSPGAAGSAGATPPGSPG